MDTYYIYTDGSVFNFDEIGHSLASCAWFITGENRILNSGTKGYVNKTITFAELSAVIWALQSFQKSIGKTKIPPYNIEVYSDSQFVVKGINEWMKKWKINGWYNAEGIVVSYKTLFQHIDITYINNPLYNIQFYHIPRKLDRSNFHSVMNRKCDTAAKAVIQKLKEKYNKNNLTVKA